MKVHDESKAMKCDVCLKLFSTKRELKRHYRTHTGEKPFACQICDKKYSQKHALTRHQATHRDGKPFKYNVCPENKVFSTKICFILHIAYH